MLRVREDSFRLALLQHCEVLKVMRQLATEGMAMIVVTHAYQLGLKVEGRTPRADVHVRQLY
jgi:ABC-type polar amino acid transport system ATPase subunit